MPRRRAVVLVLDGVGAGALPDASGYGDENTNSLCNTADAVDGLRLPNLACMGLGNIVPIRGVPPVDDPSAAHGRMRELSAGKDSTTGHWELMGVVVERPFPTYPEGFGDALLREFAERIGRGVLGGRPASGTQIIRELGAEHVATGRPIVYTSADSVFQIAAHEEVVSVGELYDWCGQAREMLVGDNGVARVIARPFTGSAPHFTRTPRRRDFALPPPAATQLDVAIANGLDVHGVGKIDDLFAGRGVTDCRHVADNAEALAALCSLLGRDFDGIAFANFNETDSRYGHRNDVAGYAGALESFDAMLPELGAALGPGDLLVITADHGCDPTTPGTDHTREYVPVLARGPEWIGTGDLGTRDSLTDVAATIARHLDIPQVGPGTALVARGS